MKFPYSQWLSSKWWRRYCWSLAGVAVGLTSLRVVVAVPVAVNAQDMTLTQRLTIPGWEQYHGHPLGGKALEPLGYNRLVDQRQYEFVRQSQRVTLTAITLDHTTGEVVDGLRQFGALSPEAIATMATIESAHGHYGLLQDGNRYYLASCLHNDGHGTLTAAEYDRHAGARLVQPETLVGWLLGQQPIPDRRCWWVMLETVEQPDAVMPAPELLRQVCRR
jgi:cyanosortase A-associated protein